MSVSDPYYPRHLASRRADYERVFTWVNSKADIIAGALFKLSGTLFRVPETSELSGPLFCQLGQIYCMCVYHIVGAPLIEEFLSLIRARITVFSRELSF